MSTRKPLFGVGISTAVSRAGDSLRQAVEADRASLDCSAPPTTPTSATGSTPTRW